MGSAPLRAEDVDAVVSVLLPLLDEGNQSVLQDWAYLCSHDFERLCKDGYLVEVCPAASDAERWAPEVTMSVPRSCFTEDEITEMKRRGYA